MGAQYSNILLKEVKEIFEQKISSQIEIFKNGFLNLDKKAKTLVSFHYCKEVFGYPEVWESINNSRSNIISIQKDGVYDISLGSNEFSALLLGIDNSDSLNNEDIKLLSNIATRSLIKSFIEKEKLENLDPNEFVPLVIVKLSISQCTVYIAYSGEYFFDLQLTIKEGNEKRVTHSELVSEKIIKTEVKMSTQKISFEKLCKLKVGDVLDLKQALSEPLPILVNGNSVGQGFLVEKKEKKSIFLVGENGEH